LPDLNKLTKKVYAAQTFLMISSPLTDKTINQIFPDKKFMVWDTDLIYSYYRITGDNRFLLGGADMFLTYFYGNERRNIKSMHKKLTNYIKSKFPNINFNFEYFWPGLIGVSKDLMPLAGTDTDNPNIYYISACAGLPWASALGNYSAENLINKRTDLDKFFDMNRKFLLNNLATTIFGKKITFSLADLYILLKNRYD
jgi:gamma-glutamylputrescine oxidase